MLVFVVALGPVIKILCSGLAPKCGVVAERSNAILFFVTQRQSIVCEISLLFMTLAYF